MLAVDYCHKKGVVIRDIKADNILLDMTENGPNQPLLQICDFGYATSDARSISAAISGVVSDLTRHLSLFGVQMNGGMGWVSRSQSAALTHAYYLLTAQLLTLCTASIFWSHVALGSQHNACGCIANKRPPLSAGVLHALAGGDSQHCEGVLPEVTASDICTATSLVCNCSDVLLCQCCMCMHVLATCCRALLSTWPLRCTRPSTHLAAATMAKQQISGAAGWCSTSC
eukprot:GHRR01003673.1.p1 GENE.GHRR01003673.1~~GHRR01003673.1.p1  ORF type:complete len:228 (+),score=44.03 GHRR01003673.1:1108-1791(+)